MDCKRVTAIKNGPVISTRTKALHRNVRCFFVNAKRVKKKPPDHDGREGYFCACVFLTSKSYTVPHRIPELPDSLLTQISNPHTQLSAIPVATI